MKTVRNLLNEKGGEAFSVKPGTSVYEALRLMAEHDIGALLVVDGGKLVGIFSERDYARKVILKEKSSHKTFVKEIMTPEVVTVRPQQTLNECMAIMSRKHIRHLPVIDGDNLIGMISMRDVVQAIIADQQEAIEKLEQAVTGSELLE